MPLLLLPFLKAILKKSNQDNKLLLLSSKVLSSLPSQLLCSTSLVLTFSTYLVYNKTMLLAQADITNVPNPATNFTDPATWNIAGLLTGGTGSFSLVNLAFFLVGFVFFANLVIAAVTYIMSEGSPDNVSKANSRFTTGLIGLIVVFASFVIVRLVAALFSLDASVPIN